MSKTSNYMLTTKVELSNGPGNFIELPAGSFVRPIETKYIPTHVLERFPNQYANLLLCVFCYTRFGIHAIEKDKIRRVE